MRFRSILFAATAFALCAIAAAPFVPAIRAAFALVCHQSPERSFAWFGAPMPVCARCLGLYVGFVAAALLPVRFPRTALVVLAAANLLDWLLALAPNAPRCILAIALAWPAVSWLLISREHVLNG